eukprot:1547022-Pyramimonas_sp.AAC.1
MDPEAATKAFFDAETFVDILTTHAALRESCGVQGYGRQSYETIKAKTSHRHQCKQLWDILDRKRNSSKTYKAEVRLWCPESCTDFCPTHNTSAVQCACKCAVTSLPIQLGLVEDPIYEAFLTTGRGIVQHCREQKVLIVGAGPAGLRTAVHLMMMGADVLVVEKRPYLTRNNVLHLWPTTVQE